MFTISENISIEIIIKNSRFISYLCKVNTIKEVDNYLNEIKKQYKDANHYCYAYIIDNNTRFSDDNEPNRTAGIPILEVLKKNNLNFVLAVVVRYFGGIKLGASGLVRAYTKSISSLINKDIVVQLIKGKEYIISFDYDISMEIEFILRNEQIIKKDYNEKIIYCFKTANIDIISSIENNNKITILNITNVLIEKNSN